MKKLTQKFLLIFTVLALGLGVFAADQDDALKFFNDFVSASNNYKPNLLSMYSENARIIRQVVKPSGKLVNVYFSTDDYKKQMKLSAKIAKIKNYKNNYSNIEVTKVSNGYRIDAMRQPSLSNYKLKTYTIVQKQPSGKWVIVEEMMQTKEQIFLKYAK